MASPQLTTRHKSFPIWLALTFCSLPLLAQTDQVKKAAEQLSPRIGLTTTQINGDSIQLEATIKVKRDGALQPVDFEKVRFFDRNDSISTPIGEALSDDKGMARITVGTAQLTAGEDGSWIIGTAFEAHGDVKEGDAEITIVPAEMTLVGEKKDTVCFLTVRLTALTGSHAPIPDAEVAFYVKRYFSNLKIGEGVTDEKGETTIECPLDLRGDENGNIFLIGKAEDLEEYGSVSAFTTKPWGIPQDPVAEKKTRALWSHSPPLWMVIVFAILMSVVWGHYIVIIYKLAKLRKQN